jgi:ParB family chromosome partitioning protein
MTVAARLADLPDLNNVALLDEAPGASGAPLLLPCELIDEDPAQPRTEFDATALRELAATIAERGVKQPVSVRRHPHVAGRWMLNVGARRLRASKLAGKAEIPAFIDDAADSFDQVIENEQRDGLRPLELALFVQRQLGTGLPQAEIARRLGKSRSYVTYVCALIDAPEWLIAVYRSGACTGAHELYDLRRLHGTHPQAVEQFVAANRSISRADVVALQSELQCQTPADGESNAALTHARVRAERTARTTLVTEAPVGAKVQPEFDPVRTQATGELPSLRAPMRLSAEFDGERVEIELLAVPASPQHVYERVPVGEKRRVFAIARLSALHLSR